MDRAVDGNKGRAKGLTAVIELEGRKTRSCTISVSSLKPIYRRSSDLRPPIGDEFAQIAWGADLGLEGHSVAVAPIYALRDRKNVESEVKQFLGNIGKISRWGFIRLGQGEKTLDNFASLQLETFHALWNLNPPSGEQTQTTTRRKKYALLSRREALARFPTGTRVATSFAAGDRQIRCVGQVYEFCSPYWRVRFPDNDWEELTA